MYVLTCPCGLSFKVPPTICFTLPAWMSMQGRKAQPLLLLLAVAMLRRGGAHTRGTFLGPDLIQQRGTATRAPPIARLISLTSPSSDTSCNGAACEPQLLQLPPRVKRLCISDTAVDTRSILLYLSLIAASCGVQLPPPPPRRCTARHYKQASSCKLLRHGTPATDKVGRRSIGYENRLQSDSSNRFYSNPKSPLVDTASEAL